MARKKIKYGVVGIVSKKPQLEAHYRKLLHMPVELKNVVNESREAQAFKGQGWGKSLEGFSACNSCSMKNTFGT